LLNNIFVAAYRIDEGRKGFTMPGKESQGRIAYEDGIARSMSTFQEAQRNGEPLAIILVEAAFLNHELQFCAEDDTDTRSSLAYAIQSFRDAMRSLEAVENACGYKIAEKTYLTDPKKRVYGFPMDAFHQACSSHKTRLRNILRAPGINMREKALLEQRAANMKAAQNAYIEKQKNALAN
jgi:hypothetical protein